MRLFVLISCLTATVAFLGKQPLRTNVSPISMKFDFSKAMSEIKKKSIPAVLASFLVFNPIHDANAIGSGSRAGGSSFRSSSSFRPSSTRMNAGSRSYGGGGMSVMPFMPMYSPFGFSPFGFIPINFNLLIIGGIAYAAYTILSNRIGGSDFSNENEGGMLSGATVLKIQLALDSDWNAPGNIMNTLSDLANRNAAMAGRGDLSKLLSETSLALIRKQGDWNSVAFEGEQLGGGQKAETAFQRITIQERSKFEKENTPQMLIKSSNSQVTNGSTQAVVSVVVALRGNNGRYPKTVTSVSEARACLQQLAADSLTDGGENIMGVEILWTPDEPGQILSARDLITDYPELLRL